VIDVGKALEVLAYDDNTAGETFELYGPKEYTLKQIANMVDKSLLRTHRHINLPKRVYKAFASVLDYLWWPTVSPDEVEREFIDQKVDASAKTFKDLGIVPTDVADDMFHYIRHYRLVGKYLNSILSLANLAIPAVLRLTSTYRR
jgi:NADH dehydrogenase (ubiquinone) 1 alpha subcomplex subunit 9